MSAEAGVKIGVIFSCAGGSAHSREELQDLRRRQEREQQLKAKYAGVYRKVGQPWKLESGTSSLEPFSTAAR